MDMLAKKWIDFCTPQGFVTKELYDFHRVDKLKNFTNKGEEYVITPDVVTFALGVPLVQQPVFPYTESHPFDGIMSLLTGTSIRWGIDPRITFHELTELNYLFLSDFLSFHLAYLLFTHYSS